MPLSMHQASVPLFLRQLRALSALLTKGEAFAQAEGLAPSELIEARLAPDMLPLAWQVSLAADIARGGSARLAGVDVPPFESGKTSFEELGDTLQRSIAFLNTLSAAQFADAAGRTITWSTRSSTKSMAAVPYLFNHVLPNVFFHVTTAYDILRHSGVEIGKADYLGRA